MKRYLPLLLLLIIAPIQVSSWETIWSDLKRSGSTPGRGALGEGIIVKELGSSVVLPKLTDLPPLVIDWNGRKAVFVSEDGYFIFVDKNGMISKFRACSSGEVITPSYGVVNKEVKALVYSCWNPSSGSLNVKIMTLDGRIASISGVGIVKPYPDYMSERAPSPLVVDFDGDGVNEVFWVDNSRLWWKDDPYSMESEYFIFSSEGKVKGLSAGDVDEDGLPEVLLGTVNGILVKDHNKDILGELSSEPCYGPPVVGDLNGDGKDDVVAYSRTSIAAIINGERSWRVIGNFGFPAVADFNGDGKDDVAYVENRRYLTVISGTGGQLWKFDPKVSGEVRPHQPAVADLDSDGLPEAVILVGSYLMIVDNDGKLMRKVFLDYMPVTRPSIGDLDGDGFLEVILGVKLFVGSYMTNHRVLMLDEPEGTVDNPPTVSFLSPKNMSTVGPSIDLKVAVSDDKAAKIDVTIYALYKNWTSIYTGKVESGDLIEININSAPEIRVEASDGIHLTTATLKLHLMNKPPGLIISPKNMSTIIAQNALINVQPTYHVTGEMCWVSLDYKHRSDVPWSRVVNERAYLCGTQIKFNVTDLVLKVRGYVQFRITARDRFHNQISKLMVYKVVGKPLKDNLTAIKEIEVKLEVGEGPFSKYVPLRVEGVFEEAWLYYRKEGSQEWTKVGKVKGDYQWEVASLSDGLYQIKVEARSGNLTATDSAQVLVDNTPPNANLTVSSKKVRQGSEVIARIEVNEDVKVYWDTDGDGSFDSLGPLEAKFRPKKTGEFIISAKIVDKAGNYVIRRAKVMVVPAKSETVSPSYIPKKVIKRSSPEIPMWALAISVALTLILSLFALKRRRGRRVRRVNPWISE